MKKLTAIVVLGSLLAPTVALAVDSKGAAYFGGTVTSFKEAKDPVEGTLDTKDDNALVFVAGDKPFKGERLSIPYKTSSIWNLARKPAGVLGRRSRRPCSSVQSVS